MARKAQTNAPARIVRVPGVCGGDPTVEGTRVLVHNIVIEWQYYQDLERVHEAFPHVDIPSIKAALSFYEDNRAEIDHLIEEAERDAYSTD